MVDITPIVSKNVQLIQAYGEEGFRIADVRYAAAVLVTTGWSRDWGVTSLADANETNLAALKSAEPAIELLIVGCGKSLTMVPAGFRTIVKSWGISFEQMDTGAACRTYNVLLTEGRRVAAALLPIS